MTKEELKNTKIWFGEDKILRDRIFEKLKNTEIIHSHWKNSTDCSGGDDLRAYIIDGGLFLCMSSSIHTNSDFHDYPGKKEITPSQLLGETEAWEPKENDWVVGWHATGTKYSQISWQVGHVRSGYGRFSNERYVVPKNDSQYATGIENIRLARPEEIPQEEVEYVECIQSYDGFSVGKIYPTKPNIKDDNGEIRGGIFNIRTSWNEVFKPSTREAYEAQQDESSTDYECVECIVNTSLTNRVFKAGGYYVPEKKGKEWFTYEGQQYSFKGSTLAFKRLPKNNHVNKCSTINTNQNECKNENREKVILRRKAITVPRGKRKTGSKVQAKRLLSPSKSRS